MAEFTESFWSGKMFMVITGASRGIGKNFAIELSRKLSNDSLIVLIARNVINLESVKNFIHTVNSTIRVVISPLDIATASSSFFSKCMIDAMEKFDTVPTDFAKAMLIHNAGTVGDVSQSILQMNDATEWQEYLSLNFISVSVLTSEFLKIFSDDCIKKVLVNLTSLCAIQPFKSMGYYCVGKAAREMYFKVLAEENPSINVLSYSPGCVDTDMVSCVIENLGDEDMKENFLSLKESNSILTVHQTTNKFIQILESGKYKSGYRVDYHDEII